MSMASRTLDNPVGRLVTAWRQDLVRARKCLHVRKQVKPAVPELSLCEFFGSQAIFSIDAAFIRITARAT